MKFSIALLLVVFCIDCSLAADTCRRSVSLQPQISCGPQQTMYNEGECLCCYYNSEGIPTIGVGFDLQRPDAAEAMAKYQLNIFDVLLDCQNRTTNHCLTDLQAQGLFVTSQYPEFEQCADQFAPGLPPAKRAAVIDMAFMGCDKLSQLTKMQAALQMRDWNTAASEAKSSKWCTDVDPNRCNSDYNCIKGCNGLTCGFNETDCASNPVCRCYATADGNGHCLYGNFTCTLPDCSPCPAATGICIVNTCCDAPICIPLEYAQACEDLPTIHANMHAIKKASGTSSCKTCNVTTRSYRGGFASGD